MNHDTALVEGNRINAMIAKKEAEIVKRVADGLTTTERVEEARIGLDLSVEEYTKFQEIKSLAHACGLITLSEANTIYQYLGPSHPDTFNNQPVAVKTILTTLFQELLLLRIKGAF